MVWSLEHFRFMKDFESAIRLCHTRGPLHPGTYDGVPGEIQLKRSFKRQDDSDEDFKLKNPNLQV